MVLFDEDPVTLISETTTQFHIAPDKDSLTRISGSLSALQNTRAARLDQHTTILKNLSRRLNTLQSQVGFEEERHDAGKHAAEMLRMDTEKFRVAKGVSEVEWEGERLGSEVASLRGVLESLEREGVEGGRRAGAEAEDEIVYVWPARSNRSILTVSAQAQATILSITGHRCFAGSNYGRIPPGSHPEYYARRCQRGQRGQQIAAKLLCEHVLGQSVNTISLSH